MNKVNPLTTRASIMAGTDEVGPASDNLFEAIKTHIEPQLAKANAGGSGPFALGKDRMTLFEVSRSFTVEFENTSRLRGGR